MKLAWKHTCERIILLLLLFFLLICFLNIFPFYKYKTKKKKVEKFALHWKMVQMHVQYIDVYICFKLVFVFFIFLANWWLFLDIFSVSGCFFLSLFPSLLLAYSFGSNSYTHSVSCIYTCVHSAKIISCLTQFSSRGQFVYVQETMMSMCVCVCVRLIAHRVCVSAKIHSILYNCVVRSTICMRSQHGSVSIRRATTIKLGPSLFDWIENN